MQIYSWEAFKNTVNVQNLRCKWVELENDYLISAFDNQFAIEITLPKTDPKNDDQIDFEENYKEQWTKPNVVRSVLTFGNEEWPELVGFSFTAPKDSVSVHEFEFEKGYQLQGASAVFQDAVIGDHTRVEIFDKNNVLGYGAGFVLHVYAKSLHIFPNIFNEFKDVDLAQLPVAGLFAKLTYTSVGTQNDVKVAFNFYTYILKV